MNRQINPNRMIANARDIIARFIARNKGQWRLLTEKEMNGDIYISRERFYTNKPETKGWILIASYDTSMGRLYIHVWRD